MGKEQNREVLQEVFALGNRLTKSIIYLLFCLGVVGCFLLASCDMPLMSHKAAMDRLAASPGASYQGFANFPYENLSLNESKVFWIDENSSAFDFDTGKSFFRAFALPQSPTPYTVIVHSYLLGSARRPSIFVPRVIILNDRFTVTRTKELRRYGLKPPLLSIMLGGFVHIDQPASDERYMVILTNRHALTQKIPSLFTIGETGKVSYLLRSPVGKLRVIIE